MIADSGFSAKSLDRAGLQLVLTKLDDGDAEALLAPRLDRLSRSVVDLAGKFTAHVLAAAEYELDLIGVRTREGMAQRKAEGIYMGRPPTLPWKWSNKR